MLRLSPRRFAATSGITINPRIDATGGLTGSNSKTGTTIHTRLTHGRIGQGADSSMIRGWDRGNFCALCKEPFGEWNNHRGKRDHICLELFFNVIAETARSWRPAAAILDHQDKFSKDIPMNAMFRHLDRDQYQRRQHINCLIRHLRDRGVIFLGPAQWRDQQLNKIQMGHHGAVVTFLQPHPQIINLFPKADAAQIASFSQACYNQYSMETVFDFLGMGELVDLRELTDGDPAIKEADLHWTQKAVILRNIMGQIRFAMSDGYKTNHPLSKRFEPHIEVLCEELSTSLVTEILFVRANEFVTRADTVWREYGCPTIVPPFSGTARDISKHGMSRSDVPLPGMQDHMPMSPTENAIQMIGACYHSALANILGPSQGRVSHRVGGDAFREAVDSVIYPLADPRKLAKQALHALAQHRVAPKEDRSTGRKIIQKPPPLSNFAEELFCAAAHLQTPELDREINNKDAKSAPSSFGMHAASSV